MQKLMQKFLSISNKSFFWLLLILLVFVPLYPKFPLLNIQGTFVAIRIEDLLVAATMLWWGSYILFAGLSKKMLQDKLNQALLLFFFIGAVSLFSAIFLTNTISWHLGVLHWLRRIEFMMLLPFAAYAIKSKRQLFVAVAVLFIVAFTVNVYALGQEFLDWPVVSTGNSEFSKGQILRLTPDARVNSTFAGHYDLAVFLVLIITIATALIFSLKKVLFNLWLAILSGLSFFVLVMTAARLSFVAMAVGVGISLLLTRKKIFILLMGLFMVGALIYPSQLRDRFVSTITINLQKNGERYTAEDKEQKLRSKLNIPTLMVNTSSQSAQPKFESTSSGIASDITPGEPTDPTQLGVYRSFAIRLDQEWPRAIRAFIKNPFLGSGYSSLGLATDNDFLRSLGEVGLLGTIAFVLIFVEVIKRLQKAYRVKDLFLKYFSAGVLAVVIAFIVNGIFIDVFEASKIAAIFWIILGMGLAIRNFSNE